MHVLPDATMLWHAAPQPAVLCMLKVAELGQATLPPHSHLHWAAGALRDVPPLNTSVVPPGQVVAAVPQ